MFDHVTNSAIGSDFNSEPAVSNPTPNDLRVSLLDEDALLRTTGNRGSNGMAESVVSDDVNDGVSLRPTENVPNELRGNTNMILWLCKRDKAQRQLVADLESTVKELENAARHQDERKVQLQDKIQVLNKEIKSLNDQMPKTYLKWQRRASSVSSKVCVIQ